MKSDITNFFATHLEEEYESWSSEEYENKKEWIDMMFDREERVPKKENLLIQFEELLDMLQTCCNLKSAILDSIEWDRIYKTVDSLVEEFECEYV